MLFSDITILDENLELKEHMYVGVEGKTVSFIGPSRPEKDFGKEYDGRGRSEEHTSELQSRI